MYLDDASEDGGPRWALAKLIHIAPFDATWFRAIPLLVVVPALRDEDTSCAISATLDQLNSHSVRNTESQRGKR
jgi:hypothetical protein